MSDAHSGIKGFQKVSQAASPGPLYWRHVGVLPYERWYAAGHVCCDDTTTATFSFNTLYSAPFFSPRGGTLDKFAFEVTTAASSGGVARMGIYEQDAPASILPGKLVADFGGVATTSTGVKMFSLSVRLLPDRLYWFVVLPGTRNVVLRALSFAMSYPIAGVASNSLIPRYVLTGSYTYAALPNRWPGIPTVGTGNVPLMASRYSA